MTANIVDDKAKTVAALGVTIVDFGRLTGAQLSSAAQVLRDALAHTPSGYHAAGIAEAEVAARREATDWIGGGALQDERLVGWIGAIKTYEHGWEIHPLVVAPDRQRLGIGSTLLGQLEARARREGIVTLFLGSDDDYGGTNVFGVDVWPDVLSRAASVQATHRGHALDFYRRHGYAVVGLLPDVNAPGRHDILMAKRLT
jgi:aminoglycoside 6'-N-acetyltransferase I